MRASRTNIVPKVLFPASGTSTERVGISHDVSSLLPSLFPPVTPHQQFSTRPWNLDETPKENSRPALRPPLPKKLEGAVAYNNNNFRSYCEFFYGKSPPVDPAKFGRYEEFKDWFIYNDLTPSSFARLTEGRSEYERLENPERLDGDLKAEANHTFLHRFRTVILRQTTMFGRPGFDAWPQIEQLRSIIFNARASALKQMDHQRYPHAETDILRDDGTLFLIFSNKITTHMVLDVNYYRVLSRRNNAVSCFVPGGGYPKTILCHS